MGNSLPNKSSKKTRLVRRMSPENYENIVKPSGMTTGKDQLDYIKEKGFIQQYEKPYPVIKGHTLEYYIPEGTKLYHSSFTYYQNFDKDRITYFGIDIIIALWYLFEESPKYNDDNFGYIYEFIVKKNIPVYILENIKDHPYNYSGVGKICQNKKIACIHPQYAYHGDSMRVNYKEMSTELTMYLNNYPIKDYIERAIHPKTEKEIIYLADIRKLKEIAELEKIAGKTLPYSEHNSIKQSIVGMVPDKNLNKTIEQSIVGMVPNKNPNNNSKNNRSRSSNKKGGYCRVLRKTKKTHFKSRK